MYELTAPIEPIEQSQIEESVLRLLGLTIIDLDDYSDEVIPDNYPRFHVKRGEREIGTISTWGNKYCTRMGDSSVGYSSLYEAATCWCKPKLLKELEDMARTVLEHGRNSMPDYI